MTRKSWTILVIGVILAALLPLAEFHLVMHRTGFRTGALMVYLFSARVLGACGVSGEAPTMALTCFIYALHVGLTLRIWFSNRKLGVVFAGLLIVLYVSWLIAAQNVQLEQPKPPEQEKEPEGTAVLAAGTPRRVIRAGAGPGRVRVLRRGPVPDR
jgi:hypothetical protein